MYVTENPDVAPDTRIVVISAWAGEHRAVLQELGGEDTVQCANQLRLQQLTICRAGRCSGRIPDLADRGSVRTRPLTVSPVWPQPCSFHLDGRKESSCSSSIQNRRVGKGTHRPHLQGAYFWRAAPGSRSRWAENVT